VDRPRARGGGLTLGSRARTLQRASAMSKQEMGSEFELATHDPSRKIVWVSFSLSLVLVLAVAVAATLNDHHHGEALPPPPALAR
jgi:hypothetical protein